MTASASSNRPRSSSARPSRCAAASRSSTATSSASRAALAKRSHVAGSAPNDASRAASTRTSGSAWATGIEAPGRQTASIARAAGIRPVRSRRRATPASRAGRGRAWSNGRSPHAGGARHATGSADRVRRARPCRRRRAPGRSASVPGPPCSHRVAPRGATASSRRRAGRLSVANRSCTNSASGVGAVTGPVSSQWPRRSSSTPDAVRPVTNSRRYNRLPALAVINVERANPSIPPGSATSSSSRVSSGPSGSMSMRATNSSRHNRVTASGAPSPVRSVSTSRTRSDMARCNNNVADASSSSCTSSTETTRCSSGPRSPISWRAALPSPDASPVTAPDAAEHLGEGAQRHSRRRPGRSHVDRPDGRHRRHHLARQAGLADPGGSTQHDTTGAAVR